MIINFNRFRYNWYTISCTYTRYTIHIHLWNHHYNHVNEHDHHPPRFPMLLCINDSSTPWHLLIYFLTLFISFNFKAFYEMESYSMCPFFVWLLSWSWSLHGLCVVICFHVFWVTSRSRIFRSYGRCSFNFLRNCQFSKVIVFFNILRNSV